MKTHSGRNKHIEATVSLHLHVDWIDLPIYRQLRIWESVALPLSSGSKYPRPASVRHQDVCVTLWNGADGVRWGEGSLCQDPHLCTCCTSSVSVPFSAVVVRDLLQCLAHFLKDPCEPWEGSHDTEAARHCRQPDGPSQP